MLTVATRTPAPNSNVVFVGNLHSAPSSSYRLDFYYSTFCDASAPTRASAQAPIGHAAVATNAAGDSAFTIILPALPVAMAKVAATATSANGDTSEIGNCVAESNGALPNALFANGFE